MDMKVEIIDRKVARITEREFLSEGIYKIYGENGKGEPLCNIEVNGKMIFNEWQDDAYLHDKGIEVYRWFINPEDTENGGRTPLARYADLKGEWITRQWQNEMAAYQSYLAMLKK